MTEATTTQFIISDAVRKQIDHWLTKYPADQKRSASIPALLLVQEQNNGWLSDAAMDATAAYLGLTKIEIYEVATFYDLYELEPVGTNKISVCTNVSCMLNGSDEILACIKKRLGVGPGETTQDGKFTIREVECMAACGGAPMCQVNNKEYFENLTPAKMEELIDKLERESHERA